ncbi:MAG: FAD:protein FMN transferase [Lachnospiraceae bacterium]|nr:FAD:protein FMN transferase [Lachnospiraceae bacterium]
MKRIAKTIALSLAAVCMLASCTNKAPEYAGGLAMDTVFNITVYGEPDLAGELLDAGTELDEKVLNRFESESMISVYSSLGANDDSPKGSSGTGAASMTAVISGAEVDLEEILAMSEELRASSYGVFDVRLGVLSDLWDIKGRMNGDVSAVIPGPSEIQSALGDRSVYDLGAVGKGVYLDMAHDILENSKAQAAVVSAGGSVLVYGLKPDGSDFKVAITDPLNPVSSGEPFATIVIEGGYFISTSGSYERFFEYGDERYCHILDPLSGYPAWTSEDIANRVGIPAYAQSSPSEMPSSIPVSVTVISRSGFYSDALSTACFVLGPDMGTALAERYDSEAVFIMSDGKVITTDGIIYDAGKKEITLC